METTSPRVYAAIHATQKILSARGVDKNQKTTGGASYKFRGIDDLYNALAPALAESGLVILPRIINRECQDRQTKGGAVMQHVVLTVEYDLVAASDGSIHTVRSVGECFDSGDKATNKAMTAAFKYLCFELFCIPLTGSDDADATNYELESDFVDAVQIEILNDALAKREIPVADFCAIARINDLAELRSAKFAGALRHIKEMQK